MLEVNFSPFPELQTGRLVLRQITEEDADAIFFLRSDKNVMQYIDRPPAASVDDALELIKKIKDALAQNEGITWAVTLKGDNTLIGTIGYWRIEKEHHRAEIGYLLHPDQQGKGIMQEALSAVIDHGFKVMALHSIEANVNPGNTASIKLLERNKFLREAWFRENYYYNGRFLDSFIYSLITPVQPGE
jgi:ribosomal-protein-alanine N-acetyltransferase